MRISLISGLMLRQGERTIELVRQLSEDEYQFEDCLTRRPLVIKRVLLLKRIWNRTYDIVLSDKPGDKHEEFEKDVRIDINTLQENVRKEIERRLEYVSALQKAHITRGQRLKIESLAKQVAKRIGDMKPPSASTVMAWARKYQKTNLNPLALRSGNASRVRAKRTHPVMHELVSRIIRTVYLTRDRNTLRHTLDTIRTEAKKLVERGALEAAQASFSLASLSRRVREIDLFRRIAAREGHARARMVCRAVMGGAGAAYPLQRVEIDHTPLNWVVICERTGLPLGRPLLTVVIDAYSSYVLGIYLSFYGAGLTSVSGAIRNALIPKDEFISGIKLDHRWLGGGLFDEIFVDNGLEFHARTFKALAWELACDLTYCRVRTPWLKPHVERFFAGLDYLTLARGRIRKRVANILNVDPRKDAAITFTNLVKGLIMFCVDVHPFQVNERKLARPYDLMSEGLEFCPPASFPPDMDRLRLSTALAKEFTVDAGGIGLRGLPYGSEELLRFHKRYGGPFRALVKWDPDNLEYVWMQDPQDKSWITCPCRWEDYVRGLSWNQHLLIRRFTRSELKLKGAYDDLQRGRAKLHEHWMEATSFKTSADAKLYAQFSGVTSANVIGTPNTRAPSPEKVIADAEVAPEHERVIPEFDAFVL